MRFEIWQGGEVANGGAVGQWREVEATIVADVVSSCGGEAPWLYGDLQWLGGGEQ